MDEVNVRVQPQSSVCSDSNGEEYSTNEVASKSSTHLRICLIGNLASDESLRKVADSFGVLVVASETGSEYTHDESVDTWFVLESFEGEVFTSLSKLRQCLLGPIALQQLALKSSPLPDKTRPLFNLAMMGVVVCFTGFRNKEDLAAMVPLIHHMGGSIRKNMSEKVTHLIANICSGEKYQYAAIFRLATMNPRWVYASWERRHELDFSATTEDFVNEHRLKPFHGAKVCFIGFPAEEEEHMTEILIANGGTLSTIDDPHCTHVVMEQSDVFTLEAATPDTIPSSTELNPIQENPRTPETDVACQFKQSLTLLNASDNSSDSPVNRKRKNSDSGQSERRTKRRKDKSEKKERIADKIFKTPINYFSQRRRTVDVATVSGSLDESVASSSENSANDQSRSAKKRKKSLFTRTFSSTKFSRAKSKKRDLNATRLSFGDDSGNEGNETFYTSCILNTTLDPVFDSENPASNSELPNGGTKDTHGPTAISVVDESTVTEKPEVSSKVYMVKAEWFWTSVQKQQCLEEKEYLYDDYVEQVFSPSTRRDSHQATPSSASRRKRKRLHDTLLSLAQQSPGLHKRRSSVSDAGLLSVSGSFLDCTVSPDKALVDGAEPTIDTPRKGLTARQQVFLEMVQTESNYVDILHTIMTMFKKHLEDMPEEEALLNNTELNLIFGKIPPIYETHVKMLNDMRSYASSWSEDHRIGSIIVKYSKELLRAYPQYINYFEEMKEVLMRCDQTKPRFHAFLKACQTKPECGRQSLQELIIRPVQRLGSMCLLLANILKHTPKTNPDNAELDKALDVLKQGMDLINEDKRKAEAQVTLFSIFNDIENCPPDILCAQRKFIAKAEVIQLSSTEGLSSKGNSLILFLFSDQVEVVKKKSKGFNNVKSPSGTGSLQRSVSKPYKHVKLIPLNTIKKVVDVKETEQCQKVFCFICRNNEDVKERIYSFVMTDDECDKTAFLKTFTKQMANNACTPDSDKFLAYLEANQLDIDTSDVSNGTLSKAFKFASKTRLKVGRAFSFNKTPSKLKRAVSSMMSPFGSSNNLTPASELAQMRLASYNHINELGSAENASESPPVAPPLSVQPTRKMKSSLNVNALKRL